MYPMHVLRVRSHSLELCHVMLYVGLQASSHGSGKCKEQVSVQPSWPWAPEIVPLC